MTEKTVPMKYRRMEFNAQLQTENDRLRAQRDALLEALELAADFLEHSTEFRIGHPGFEGAQAKARAAIKAVEEEA